VIISGRKIETQMARKFGVLLCGMGRQNLSASWGGAVDIGGRWP
jgi:hypothetical protein